MKTQSPLQIDGATGEGGGQILRSSLSLSLVTGRAFEIQGIRAGRKKPGLLRQHLTAVQAAAAVGAADVSGAHPGSTELSFSPSKPQAGDYHFAVGTAGSAILVLQTVLPALITLDAPSTVCIEGGTHNPNAPCFEHLKHCFLPCLENMGPRVHVELEQHGFYPVGGGKILVHIEPTPSLRRVDFLQRGLRQGTHAKTVLCNLPYTIGERELSRLQKRLNLATGEIVQLKDAPGHGNVVLIEICSEHMTEIIASYAMRGVSSEKVAGGAIKEARRYLQSEAPVGVHLADQLMLPMAIAGGGKMRAVALTEHAKTNLGVIDAFLNTQHRITRESNDCVSIEIYERESVHANT